MVGSGAPLSIVIVEQGLLLFAGARFIGAIVEPCCSVVVSTVVCGAFLLLMYVTTVCLVRHALVQFVTWSSTMQRKSLLTDMYMYDTS